ncbi:MAG: phage tail tape measure protein [Ruminococcus sp.]|nr:phage tail tape measure protein [Ruminococcus sp.]
MFDDGIVFDTAVDPEGLEEGMKSLSGIAQTAVGTMLGKLGTQIISGIAQIPAQITAVGSSFEASMSQVAATMSITTASQEFDLLSSAAKAAGESTKFSATQAGDALNFLALAGYSAEQAVTALPTVLNTAAAGGLDLAYASDLITDSMSALGLGMEELSSFSDRLAVTSQKSNTNVAQLGEAILTVGGTAKTLSGGVVEMNTALGILADNGIKGAEGGTALRNVILSLSAPTSTAADMLNKLNVSAFDAAGNMRPLQGTFGDLNTALEKLNPQERQAALSEIFNKVDLKSVNALLGTSAERFDELSGYIENCEGAASDMADTMSSNLKGDITIMQSALEGLGVSIYEKFSVPMRTAVQGITETIGELTSRIKDGDLSDTFDKISEGFARLTTAAVDLLGNTVLPLLANVLGAIVDKADTLVPVIGSAVTALVAYKGIVTAATTAQTLLNTVVSANPYILAASAIAALVAGMTIFNGMQESSAEIAERARSEYSEEFAEIEKTADAFKSAADAADEAADARTEELTLLDHHKQRLDELVDANGRIIGSYEEVKTLVEEINGLYPDTIELIGGQIQGYDKLSQSIDDYLESERKAILAQSKKEKYSAAIIAQDEAAGRTDELKTAMDEAEKQYQRFAKFNAEAQLVHGLYTGALDDMTAEEKAAWQESGKSLKEWISNQTSMWQSRTAAASQAWAENQKILTDSEKVISEYESTFSKASENIAEDSIIPPPSVMPVGMSAEDNAAVLENWAEEQFNEFKSKWEQLEFDYAMGTIKTETELFDKKKALLSDYGSTSKQEYWQYYKDIAAYDKDAAEELIAQQKKQQEEFIRNQTKAFNELADNQKKAAKKAFSDWNNEFKNVVSEANKAFDDILKQKTAFSEKLSKSTSLFTWETATDKKTGEDYKYVYLGDIQQQTKDIQKYADLMGQLKAKGASAEFMAQFADLSVEDGIAFAEKLLDPGTNFDLYMSEWQKQQELISSITNEFYDGAIAELEEKFTGKINTALEAIPPNALQAGEDTVQAFIDGVSGLDINKLTLGVLEDADTAALGRTLGERFGQGFSDGIGSIGIRLADAVETSQVINGARFGGYYGGEQKPAETKVDVTTKVYLDGKEISAASESQTEINQRVQGE